MSQRGAFILNSVGHKQLTTIVQKYSVGTGTNTSTYYIPIANSWESAGAVGTYGWWTGGNTSIVDRVDFSNDSPAAATARGQLPVATNAPTGFGNSYYGWFAGVNSGASQIYRIDFSNDSPATASTRGPLPVGRTRPGSVSNNNYGWIAGGGDNPYYSYIDRINFSNDSPTAASPRGILNQSKNGLAGAANANYGWFGGGYFFPASTYYSTVERLDFSNDTATPSLRGTLPSVFANSSAASNVNYGWWSNLNSTGNPNSSVYRVDFSNDSPTAASSRGFLGYAVQAGAAAGNANFGWFGGGAPSSTISRIDYSNDSPTTAGIRGPLSVARGNLGATSNYVKALPNFIGVGSVSTGTFGAFGTPVAINTITGIAFVGSANYAWIGGGATTVVDRIDFANDSPLAASPRAILTVAISGAAAAGNASYGWFGGGNPISAVYRIDFANDNVGTAASTRGPLSSVRNQTGATSTANYGWFGGGSVPPATSSVDRIDFSNDLAVANIRGPLALARYGLAATGNANYAWWGGGYTPSWNSRVDRIDLSNDSPTAASPRGVLTVARQLPAAAGNENYGWWGGGATAVGTGSAVVDRMDYSNDSPTSTSPRGGLSAARYGLAASGNSNYGWWTGGTTPTPVQSTSVVDRIDFANDSPTGALARAGLSLAKSNLASVSNYVKARIDPRRGGLNVNLYAASTSSNTATGVTIYNGTFAWVSGTSSSVERINFATDSATASVRGPLSLARMLGSTTHNTQYGWFLGGLQPASPYARYSLVDRIDYSNDSPTAATVRGNLSIAKAQHASAGNINYGWIAGGETVLGTSSLYSSVDRIDYSNESPASSSPRGPLTAARGYLDATANEFYGWFAGGGFTVSPTAYSTVERIDFGNDSPTAAASRSNLQTATYEIAGAGNRNYGWFNRGGASTSLVERLDYSNDTVNTLLRGSLSQVRSKHSAASNSSYGWWIGGFVTPNPVSTVDRIDFSNDSPTASASRGPLAATRYGTASASNYVTTLLTGFVVTQYAKASAAVRTGAGTYGWFAGGQASVVPVTVITTVNRIDFSNDTSTPSIRGPLAAGAQGAVAAGNANYGWVAGSTLVNRIDFANDSPTSASLRGPMNEDRRSRSATSNANYGWFVGGATPIDTGSTVERIDFSNDSPTTAGIRGPLSFDRSYLGATGNANYGWFGGGQGSGPQSLTTFSTVSRIDYANDSPTSAGTRGPLSNIRAFLTATGNANYGWFGGSASLSTVDRIDFANDSPTSASPRGPMSVARNYISSSGNANYGWWSGGWLSPSPGTIFSIVERIDWSNDSPTAASPRSSLVTATLDMGATSNYVK